MRLLIIITLAASVVGAIFGYFMPHGEETASSATVFAFSGQMCVLFGFVAAWLKMVMTPEKHE